MVDYIRGLKDRYCSACGSWWTEQEAKQKNLLALGAHAWIAGVTCDLAHATEGEGLLLYA